MNKPLNTLELRGNDPTGHGYYGAKRGARLHNGLDLVTSPGEDVFSPIDGTVTKLGYPYADDLSFRYIEISNDTYRIRLMYAKPVGISLNQKVSSGDKIGIAQDIASKWNPKMKNHIHFEVYKNGLLTDPEPILIPGV